MVETATEELGDGDDPLWASEATNPLIEELEERGIIPEGASVERIELEVGGAVEVDYFQKQAEEA